MIASVAFRNFKALRATSLALAPFNLVIGPNGSGKTSLIESLLWLPALSRLAPAGSSPAARKGAAPAVAETMSNPPAGRPEIEFHFDPPHAGIVVQLGCDAESVCDLLTITPPNAPGWAALRDELASIRGYVLDHAAMGGASFRQDGAALAPDGGNLAAVLAVMKERAPRAFSALTAELLRILPEFRSLELVEHDNGRVEFGLRLTEAGVLPAAELSQGTLYLMGILALAFDPSPPSMLCIEEVDRGIHPRGLREIRDALYRLSYPPAFGSERRAVQIVVTTHSPYFIDLFRDHPEEVVISHKHGRAAHFERLADRPDLPELLGEGALGDMWFSGILGGVPDDQ